jgi:hypothetical protein
MRGGGLSARGQDACRLRWGELYTERMKAQAARQTRPPEQSPPDFWVVMNCAGG